eukprot:scaffold5_cov331-Pavlova_lutheri.AAC.44
MGTSLAWLQKHTVEEVHGWMPRCARDRTEAAKGRGKTKTLLHDTRPPTRYLEAVPNVGSQPGNWTMGNCSKWRRVPLRHGRAILLSIHGDDGPFADLMHS